MATRLYLSRQGHSDIEPGTLGSWGGNFRSRLKLRSADNEDASQLTNTINNAASGSTLHRQWISETMDGSIAFDSSTTYKVSMKCHESSTSANAFMRLYVAIVSEEGTTVRVISSAQVDGTEFSTSNSPHGLSRYFSGTGILSDYTTVAGDRLVVEIGFTCGNSGYSISQQWGNSTTTDLDAADGDSGVQNAWFETSNTITFGGTGGGDPEPDPPDPEKSYDIDTYISGFQDDWI